MAETPDSYEYDARPIEVLRGVDPVRVTRKHPHMFIGDTDDGSGLHNMVYEVVRNAIDEAVAGRAAAAALHVTLNPDTSCTVRDNGRGFPAEIPEGVSPAETIITQLQTDRKFNQSGYEMFFGLPVVDLFVVNVLSTSLKLRVWCDGKEHVMEFADGNAVAPLAIVDDAEGRSGTEVTFTPSPQIFTTTEFDFATLEDRLREFAILNSGVRIVLADKRHAVERREELHYARGVVAFSKYPDHVTYF